MRGENAVNDFPGCISELTRWERGKKLFNPRHDTTRGGSWEMQICRHYSNISQIVPKSILVVLSVAGQSRELATVRVTMNQFIALIFRTIYR